MFFLNGHQAVIFAPWKKTSVNEAIICGKTTILAEINCTGDNELRD